MFEKKIFGIKNIIRLFFLFFKHNDGILFYFTTFVLFFMKKIQKEI